MGVTKHSSPYYLGPTLLIKLSTYFFRGEFISGIHTTQTFRKKGSEHFWLNISVTLPKSNMEAKNGGLVQMSFLFMFFFQVPKTPFVFRGSFLLKLQVFALLKLWFDSSRVTHFFFGVESKVIILLGQDVFFFPGDIWVLDIDMSKKYRESE